MLQDIGEHQLDISFSPRLASATDVVICVDEADGVLMIQQLSDQSLADYSLPTIADFSSLAGFDIASLRYLCSLDELGFFQPTKQLLVSLGSVGEDIQAGQDNPQDNTVESVSTHEESKGQELAYKPRGVGEGQLFASGNRLSYQNTRTLMTMQPGWLGFGAATAVHLARWYRDNQLCSRCAEALIPSDHERALCCPACSFIVYPRINPVVIVAVTDGERLLMTRGIGSVYRRYALVAGFVEIGEALEDTVRREVMEEVGLRVKNIRYYKSQPWAFSNSVLAGFFAEVDGDTTVQLDGLELAEASWVERELIPIDENRSSLTADMIMSFREGCC